MTDDAGDVKPTPDPTELTTASMLREVGNVERLLDARLQTIEGVTDERFSSVETQFALFERQRIEQKADTKSAVDAALAAAEKAVGNQTIASEKAIGVGQAATAEQLKQTNITLSTAIAGLTSMLTDLKTRVERIESIRQGGAELRGDQRQSNAQLIAVATVVMAVVAVAVTIILATRK